MRSANRVENTSPVRSAGIACMAAAWMFAAMPAFAQDQRVGVSHPDSAEITADPADAPSTPKTPPAKPSAAIPTTPSETAYGPYVPYRASGTAAVPQNAGAVDPDATIVTEATAGKSDRRLLSGTGMPNTDLDAGIVTHVPSVPGEVPEGTLVKARLQQDLSTLTTEPGSKFTAEISSPVMHDGKVIVPVGSTLEGRVTWVRGGKRIGGSAAIHIEPRTITLPDGAQYVVRARVIDTNSWDNTKVDDEGTITRRENKKRNAGIMALTTGGGAAAGAMIGGVPGALIGAGVGAGVSTVIWLKQDRQAVLPKDLGLIFSLTESMSITPLSASAVPVKPITQGGE